MLLFDPAKLGRVSAEARQHDPASEPPMPATLEAFLAGIDARAFRFAELALRNRDDALDAVQDAMMKMLGYRDHAPSEWSPLFWSILRNRIVDLQRRALFRLRWLVPGSSNDDGEPIDDKIQRLTKELLHQFDESARLEGAVRRALSRLT